MLRRTQNPGDLATMRRRAEQFIKELATETYTTRAGLSDTSNIAAIYAQHADLPSETLFSNLRAEAKRAEGDERRRAEFLTAFVGELLAGGRTKELVDERNALEATAEVTYPWGTEAFRRSAVTLGNEPDRERRRTIAAARRVVVERLTLLARAIIDRHHETARDLGFDSYTDAIEQIGRLDLSAMHIATVNFLSETDSLYEREMSAVVAERLGQRLDETERCDIGYLWRAPEFDAMFPPENLVATAERAVSSLGLDIYAGGHIHLDIAQRPKKSPRAFTAAIEVPNRIMLVITPSGGQGDWHSFFHELGHALHFGYAEAGLEFEFRRLGDNSVTEAFAFLIEHLLLDREFLDEYLPSELTDRYLRFAYRSLLYMLRRYCAKLDYELTLHNDATTQPGDTALTAAPEAAAPAKTTHQAATHDAARIGTADSDLATAYAERLSRATLVAYDPADYLVDVDHAFYCARYLRAWFFEASLQQHLVGEFGPKWFTTREAGEFLKNLWADGQRLRLDELEAQLGFTHTDPGPLIRRITAQLQD